MGRLSVQRVYKHVIKARLYRGDQQWSEVQHFHPRDVRFDGWNPSAWQNTIDYDSEAVSDDESRNDDVDQDETATIVATNQREDSATHRGPCVSYLRVSTAE